MMLTENQVQELTKRIQSPLLAAMMDALSQAQTKLSALLGLDGMPPRIVRALKGADKIVGDGISFALTDTAQSARTASGKDPAHTVARIRGFNRIACATLDSVCSYTIALPYVKELQLIIKLLGDSAPQQQTKTA